MVVDAITESIAYMKRQNGARRALDGRQHALAGRHRLPFFKAMADAGADGVYVVDSRGNSAPLATRTFIRRVRDAVGDKCDVYVQHHNDLGVATANAMAAVEGGANWIDCVGHRHRRPRRLRRARRSGGAVRNVRHRDRHQARSTVRACRYVQKAYGIQLPPWKPIVGENWNKEEGVGHLEGSADAESTIGIAPRVVGREFEAVIGGKILFGRERSSAHTDDPVFLRDIVRDLGMEVSELQFQRILIAGARRGRQQLRYALPYVRRVRCNLPRRVDRWTRIVQRR